MTRSVACSIRASSESARRLGAPGWAMGKVIELGVDAEARVGRFFDVLTEKVADPGQKPRNLTVTGISDLDPTDNPRPPGETARKPGSSKRTVAPRRQDLDVVRSGSNNVMSRLILPLTADRLLCIKLKHGLSCGSIAKVLTADKVPSPANAARLQMGGTWTRPAVARIRDRHLAEVKPGGIKKLLDTDQPADGLMPRYRWQQARTEDAYLRPVPEDPPELGPTPTPASSHATSLLARRRAPPGTPNPPRSRPRRSAGQWAGRRR